MKPAIFMCESSNSGSMTVANTNDLLIYIRQQMLARKISIKELSDRMNKSQSATGQMFHQNNITLESLNDICNSLGYQLEINLISDKSKSDTP